MKFYVKIEIQTGWSKERKHFFKGSIYTDSMRGGFLIDLERNTKSTTMKSEQRPYFQRFNYDRIKMLKPSGDITQTIMVIMDGAAAAVG